MTDDMSWIDHPANLRANAVLLRATAEQSLLHADYIEQLRLTLDRLTAQRRQDIGQLRTKNERLRAVIVRAKDALLDGQSTQWVHDLLVKGLLEDNT
jgi:hypothetical protein